MDSRHVSSDQKKLNAIINAINKQLVAHPKTIIGDQLYCKQLKVILSKIYEYSGRSISLNDYFNEKNLLTKEPVVLPFITQDLLPNPELYDNLLNDLSAISNDFEVGEKQLYKEKLKNKILSYHLHDAKHRLLSRNIAFIKEFIDHLNVYVKDNQGKILSNESNRREDVYFILEELGKYLQLPLLKRFKDDQSFLKVNDLDFKGLDIMPLDVYINKLGNFVVNVQDRLDKLQTTLWRSTLRSALAPFLEKWNKLLFTLNKIDVEAYRLQELKRGQNDADIYVLSDDVLGNIFEYVDDPLKLHFVSQRFYQAGKELNWKRKVSVEFGIDPKELAKLKQTPEESYSEMYKRLQGWKCYVVFYQTKDVEFKPIDFLNERANKAKNYLITDSLASARNFRSKGLQPKGSIYICELNRLPEEVSQSMQDGKWNKIAPGIKRVHYLISQTPTEVEYEKGKFIERDNIIPRIR